MVIYQDNLNGLGEEAFIGFFVGWPNPPSTVKHLEILKGSSKIWLAVQDGKVIGFINAISDHIMSAYIPLLEVLPEYKNQGIGTELVRHMLDSLSHLYMVDLLCDEGLTDYYEKLGMFQANGMIIRNYNRQNCEESS